MAISAASVTPLPKAMQQTSDARAARTGRQTKIVATVGPASRDLDVLRALAEAGVDVFRLNCSHGSGEQRAELVERIRTVEEEICRPLAILLDLQGPKLRIGGFCDEGIDLVDGAPFRLLAGEHLGNQNEAGLPHPEVFVAAMAGDLLLLDDGKIRLRVRKVTSSSIDTVVEVGGRLSSRKGVSLPGRNLPIPALTLRDRWDLEHGAALGVDWIALSFVQNAEDVRLARKLVADRALILAKIERPSAMEYLEEIASEADALMVARGDLGVELPPESLPPLQRRIVRAARDQGKPVVVATQMLESMVHACSPTRAEVSDIATAVYEGADAVMLSAETATGSYPLEAVRVMDRVLRSTERDPDALAPQRGTRGTDNTCAVSAAVRTVADVMPLGAIVAFTTSGETARRISRERPRTTILALTQEPTIARRLALQWGVLPASSDSFRAKRMQSENDVAEVGTAAAAALGIASPDMPLAIVAGTPFGTPGSTNLLRLLWPVPAIAAPKAA